MLVPGTSARSRLRLNPWEEAQPDELFNNVLLYRTQGSITKRRGCVRNAGVVYKTQGYETQGSFTKRRGRVRNAGVMYKKQGSCTKCRGRVRNTGVVYEHRGRV